MENSCCGISGGDNTCGGLDLEEWLSEGLVDTVWDEPIDGEENWNLEAGVTGEGDDCCGGKKVPSLFCSLAVSWVILLWMLPVYLCWNVSTGWFRRLESLDLTASVGCNCGFEVIWTGSAVGWGLSCTEPEGRLILFACTSATSSTSTTSLLLQLACFLRSSRFCTLLVFDTKIISLSLSFFESTAFLFLLVCFFLSEITGSLLTSSSQSLAFSVLDSFLACFLLGSSHWESSSNPASFFFEGLGSRRGRGASMAGSFSSLSTV